LHDLGAREFFCLNQGSHGEAVNEGYNPNLTSLVGERACFLLVMEKVYVKN
jgi:hypothetical protein